MEQEFFEAFGIKKIQVENSCLNHYNFSSYEKDYCDIVNNNCDICKFNYDNSYYPPITPEIVLKLITILVKKHCNLTLYWGLPKLTEQILKQCIRDSKDKEIQDQVRALFND